jgi:hypothetical protein
VSRQRGQPPGTTSTIPSDPPAASMRLERTLRNVALALVSAVVLLGITGSLGVRVESSTASGNGLAINVSYARVTRGGLASPFAITVIAEEGSALPAALTVGVTSDYLALFDDNGMEPTPSRSYNTPQTTWWTFEVEDGEHVLVIELDARLEPSVQLGKEATVEVWVEGRRMVGTEFRTWVMP